MREASAPARQSIHNSAGRSGVPSAVQATTVDAVVATAIPATVGRPAISMTLRHADPSAFHQSSGACSAHPGCGCTVA